MSFQGTRRRVHTAFGFDRWAAAFLGTCGTRRPPPPTHTHRLNLRYRKSVAPVTFEWHAFRREVSRS